MIASADLADALNDRADWRVTVTLANAETGLPLDLTGSRLKATFRSLFGDELVAECSTDANDGSLKILLPASSGQVALVSLASARTWRCPVANAGRIDLPQTVVADLIRRPSADTDAATEDEARIMLLVRRSTTTW